MPFIICISRINSTQVDVAHDVNAMLMYNRIEYSNKYVKTSGILWEYCRDEPALAANGDVNDFNPLESWGPKNRPSKKV